MNSASLRSWFDMHAKILALDICVSSLSNRIYHYCIVEKKSDTLHVTEQKEHCTSLETILYKHKELPICITLSGEGVLVKHVEQPLQSIIEAQTFFPGIDLKRFHLQYENYKQSASIAIVKKEIIDAILEELKNVHVIQVGIGPIALHYIHEEIEDYKPTKASSYKIEKTDTRYLLSPLTDTYSDLFLKIGDEKILNSVLLAFASVVQYITVTNETNTVSLSTNKENYKYAFLFKKVGWSMLFITLTLLLLNTVLFIRAGKKADELQILAGSPEQQKELDSLQHVLQYQKIHMQQSGWLGSSKTSFYADRLGSSLEQSGLQITKLSVYPHDERVEDTLKFMYPYVYVEGISKNAYDVNEWKKEIENLPWVKEVKLHNFNFVNDSKSARFSIHIQIKENS